MTGRIEHNLSGNPALRGRGGVRTAIYASGGFDRERSPAVSAGGGGSDGMRRFGTVGSENDGDQAENTEKQTCGEPSENLITSIPFVIRYDHACDSAPDAHHENEHPA